MQPTYETTGSSLLSDTDKFLYPTDKNYFNPQTLAPVNLDSALATDAYQYQNADGADLIDGEANKRMDPYQAQLVQYEVLV